MTTLASALAQKGGWQRKEMLRLTSLAEGVLRAKKRAEKWRKQEKKKEKGWAKYGGGTISGQLFALHL